MLQLLFFKFKVKIKIVFLVLVTSQMLRSARRTVAMFAFVS